MFKIVGAFTIITSATILAYIPLHATKRRIFLLREWLRILERMQAELRTNLPSTIDLIRLLSTEYHIEVLQDISLCLEAQGAASFSKIWKSAILRYCKELGTAEVQALCSLGDTLGYYILEEELGALKRVIYEVRNIMEAYMQHLKTQTKLYLGTGVSLGLIVVVVLI